MKHYGVYPAHLTPTHPLMGTMLTSVGEHERNRIMRHYYPEGDPGQMAWQMQVARRYGLKVPPYLAQAGKMYGLWHYFSAPENRKFILLGALALGLVATYFVVSARKPKAKKKFSAPKELYVNDVTRKIVNAMATMDVDDLAQGVEYLTDKKVIYMGKKNGTDIWVDEEGEEHNFDDLMIFVRDALDDMDYDDIAEANNYLTDRDIEYLDTVHPATFGFVTPGEHEEELVVRASKDDYNKMLHDYVDYVNAIYDEYHSVRPAGLPKEHLVIYPGRTWDKLVKKEVDSKIKGGSAWGFVNKETGYIHKASSWSQPNKRYHVADIYDKDTWKKAGVIGPDEGVWTRTQIENVRKEQGLGKYEEELIVRAVDEDYENEHKYSVRDLVAEADVYYYRFGDSNKFYTATIWDKKVLDPDLQEKAPDRFYTVKWGPIGDGTKPLPGNKDGDIIRAVEKLIRDGKPIYKRARLTGTSMFLPYDEWLKRREKKRREGYNRRSLWFLINDDNVFYWSWGANRHVPDANIVDNLRINFGGGFPMSSGAYEEELIVRASHGVDRYSSKKKTRELAYSAKKGDTLYEFEKIEDVTPDQVRSVQVDKSRRNIVVRKDGVVLSKYSVHYLPTSFQKAHWHSYGWKRLGYKKLDVDDKGMLEQFRYTMAKKGFTQTKGDKLSKNYIEEIHKTNAVKFATEARDVLFEIGELDKYKRFQDKQLVVYNNRKGFCVVDKGTYLMTIVESKIHQLDSKLNPTSEIADLMGEEILLDMPYREKRGLRNDPLQAYTMTMDDLVTYWYAMMLRARRARNMAIPGGVYEEELIVRAPGESWSTRVNSGGVHYLKELLEVGLIAPYYSNNFRGKNAWFLDMLDGGGGWRVTRKMYDEAVEYLAKHPELGWKSGKDSRIFRTKKRADEVILGMKQLKRIGSAYKCTGGWCVRYIIRKELEPEEEGRYEEELIVRATDNDRIFRFEVPYEDTDEQWFTFIGIRFDVRKAKQILNKSPRETDEVELDNLAGMLPEKPGSKKINLLAVYVDWNKALNDPNIDLSVPLIVAYMGKEMGHVVIDGWHRIAKAVELGMDELPGYVLTEEETEEVATGLKEIKKTVAEKAKAKA